MFNNWSFRMTTYVHLLQLPYKQKSRQMRQLIRGFFNLSKLSKRLKRLES